MKPRALQSFSVLLACSLAWFAFAGVAPRDAAAQSARGRRGAAQPAPVETAPADSMEDQAARLLFESGRAAFAAGDYERALTGFQQAYELSRRPELLYNIGTTLDRMRRDDEALAIFEQFLAEDPHAPDRPEVASRVAQLRAGVEARLAREEAARLEAERVQAERLAAEEERRLAEQHRRLAEEAAGGGTPPVLMLSVGGVAVATGAMALGFGLRTRALNDSYVEYVSTTLEENGGVTGTPDQAREARDRFNRAKSRQTLTNAMLGVSGAALVGAVTLIFFTDWDGDEPTAAGTEDISRFTPSLGVSAQGLELGMSYDF